MKAAYPSAPVPSPTRPEAPEQYTPQQKRALQRLHSAATQLEGVFLDMLFSAMRDTVPKQTIFGQESNTEETFQTMLDEQRSQSVAQSGSFGIGRVLEEQLRRSVLSDASRESKTQLPTELEP